MRNRRKNFRGVIYCAHGESWATRAKASVASLRRHHPDLPVTIFSEHDFSGVDVDVRPVPAGIQPRALKMHALLNSPYQNTLYLDTDTHVCEDFTEVYDMLRSFDVSVCVSGQASPRAVRGVPACYPEMNGGVILYRNSGETRSLLEAFSRNYDQMNGEYGGFNEPALRLSLWQSDVHFAPLPPEYNFRTDDVSVASGVVKIIHGKRLSERLAYEVNARPGYRIYIPGEGIRRFATT